MASEDQTDAPDGHSSDRKRRSGPRVWISEFVKGYKDHGSELFRIALLLWGFYTVINFTETLSETAIWLPIELRSLAPLMLLLIVTPSYGFISLMLRWVEKDKNLENIIRNIYKQNSSTDETGTQDDDKISNRAKIIQISILGSVIVFSAAGLYYTLNRYIYLENNFVVYPREGSTRVFLPMDAEGKLSETFQNELYAWAGSFDFKDNTTDASSISDNVAPKYRRHPGFDESIRRKLIERLGGEVSLLSAPIKITQESPSNDFRLAARERKVDYGTASANHSKRTGAQEALEVLETTVVLPAPYVGEAIRSAPHDIQYYLSFFEDEGTMRTRKAYLHLYLLLIVLAVSLSVGCECLRNLFLKKEIALNLKKEIALNDEGVENHAARVNPSPAAHASAVSKGQAGSEFPQKTVTDALGIERDHPRKMIPGANLDSSEKNS